LLKVTVKLYGTLSSCFDDYSHQNGIDVNIRDKACIDDLLVHLNIEPAGVGMIFVDSVHADKNPAEKQQPDQNFSTRFWRIRKEYLDVGSGIAVMNVGHFHPKIV